MTGKTPRRKFRADYAYTAQDEVSIIILKTDDGYKWVVYDASLRVYDENICLSFIKAFNQAFDAADYYRTHHA